MRPTCKENVIALLIVRSGDWLCPITPPDVERFAFGAIRILNHRYLAAAPTTNAAINDDMRIDGLGTPVIAIG